MQRSAPQPLRAAGQIYQAEYTRARALWKAGKKEEAYVLCRDLLNDPFLSKWHQAGLHFILGYSDDCSVEHAQRARDTYKDIFVGRSPPPSENDLALRDKCLNAAEAVLKQALLDEAAAARTEEGEEGIDLGDPNKQDDDTVNNSDMETVGESDEESDFNPDDWEPVFGPASTNKALEQSTDADVEAKKDEPLPAEAR